MVKDSEGAIMGLMAVLKWAFGTDMQQEATAVSEYQEAAQAIDRMAMEATKLREQTEGLCSHCCDVEPPTQMELALHALVEDL